VIDRGHRKMSQRTCNECTLCCRVLPVAEIGKPCATRCAQQCAKGCRVYGTSAYPISCRLWTCAWLSDESIPLPRPDRVGYIIDKALDFIELEGVGAVCVLQIWIDPRTPLAHRDLKLRSWLARRWDTDQQIALIRFDAFAALALFPPQLTTDGRWLEAPGTNVVKQHTPAQIAQTLAKIRTESALGAPA